MHALSRVRVFIEIRCDAWVGQVLFPSQFAATRPRTPRARGEGETNVYGVSRANVEFFILAVFRATRREIFLFELPVFSFSNIKIVIYYGRNLPAIEIGTYHDENTVRDISSENNNKFTINIHLIIDTLSTYMLNVR